MNLKETQAFENSIKEIKKNRVDLDVILQHIKNMDYVSREKSIVITKLQETIMWLGMCLKDLGTANPYPNSYKPENIIVDATADDLTL